MSAMLKQKLIDIANGFTKYGLWKGGAEITADGSLSTTSENPVQNKVITENINTLYSNFGKINNIKTIDFVNGVSFKWTVAGLQPIIDSSEQLPLLKNLTNGNGFIKAITLDYTGDWKLKILFHIDGIDYEKYISLL